MCRAGYARGLDRLLSYWQASSRGRRRPPREFPLVRWAGPSPPQPAWPAAIVSLTLFCRVAFACFAAPPIGRWRWPLSPAQSLTESSSADAVAAGATPKFLEASGRAGVGFQVRFPRVASSLVSAQA